MRHKSHRVKSLVSCMAMQFIRFSARGVESAVSLIRVSLEGSGTCRRREIDRNRQLSSCALAA